VDAYQELVTLSVRVCSADFLAGDIEDHEEPLWFEWDLFPELAGSQPTTQVFGDGQSMERDPAN
jgi:hypothetical protein